MTKDETLVEVLTNIHALLERQQEQIDKLEKNLQAMTELMITKDDFDYMKRQSERHGKIIGEIIEGKYD